MSAQFQLPDKWCLDVEKAHSRRRISQRSAGESDCAGGRVAIRGRATLTEKLQVQIPSVSRSGIRTASKSNYPIQTPFMDSSHIQTPSMDSSHIQTPSMDSSHFQASSKGNSPSQTHSVGGAHLQTGNPRQRCPSIDTPQHQSHSVEQSDDQHPSVGKPQHQSHSTDLSDGQSSSMDTPQEYVFTPLNPQAQAISRIESLDQSISVSESLDETISVNESLDKSISMSESLDKSISVTESLDKSISMSESLDKSISVSESVDQASSVSNSQNPAPCVDDTDMVHSYKSSIRQLRSLRLQLVKDSTRSRSQSYPHYDRRRSHSTVSKGLQTLTANASHDNSFKQTPHLVKKHGKSRFYEDDFINPAFDNFTSSLDQDRKYIFLQCPRHKSDTLKRLPETRSQNKIETFFSKELRARTRQPSTGPHSATEHNERGCSGQASDVGTDRTQIRVVDKRCETFLQSSLRTREGQDSDLVQLLPRLRLSELPGLVGDRSCKPTRKSVILRGSKRQLPTGVQNWSSCPGNFSSKWTSWKRWIGSTLALRQTTSGSPGYHSLIQGDYRCITEGLRPGDACSHPGQAKLSDSSTDADHAMDTDSSWHRRRSDPPPSPADLEEVLSPVTRVVITTTERHW